MGKVIHGRTKIELYNPNTKIKQVFRDENTFQSSVLAKVCDPFGEFSLPRWFSYSDSVGGIFLFRDAITVGSEFMPAGNKMIGHGYRGCVTQGNYPYMGTFNSSESSAGATAITQVYDYATNQANGTIGCVSLTSVRGGQIGYGITSDPWTYSEFEDMLGAYVGDAGCLGGYYNGYNYQVTGYNEGVLSIGKTPVDVQKGNIFRGFTKTLTFDVSQIGTPKSCNWYWCIMGDVGSGKFRFWAEAEGNGIYVASGDPIYYYEFDATTETLSQHTLTNNSGEGLQLSNYGVQFYGDYCLINSFNSYNGYLFKVSNGSFVKKFDGCIMQYSLYNGDTGRYFLPAELCDDMILLPYRDSSNYHRTYLYDIVSDTIYKMNLQENSSSGRQYGRMTQLRSVDGHILKSQMRSREYVGRNPLYLATINNLQNPVTKTAAQTMKVTYTLTEA